MEVAETKKEIDNKIKNTKKKLKKKSRRKNEGRDLVIDWLNFDIFEYCYP